MPGHNASIEAVPPLATLEGTGANAPFNSVEKEKHLSSKDSEDVDIVGEKDHGYYSDEKASHTDSGPEDASSVQWVNGEPVISTGRDVSNYLIDLRDDGDAAITFRSLVLGTVFAGLGATLVQVGGLICHFFIFPFVYRVSYPRADLHIQADTNDRLHRLLITTGLHLRQRMGDIPSSRVNCQGY